MQLHRFFKYTDMQFFWGILLSFCGVPFAIADTDKFSIVTDIAPVHSLVSMVVDQQADVKLLVPPNQSPHSFSLKPSQIRIINEANLIVTLSDDFTPTLSRYLKSIDKNAIVLRLTDSNGQHRKDKHGESKHVIEEQTSNRHNNGHSTDQSDEGKANPTFSSAEHLNDPHTWLDPENAIAWLDRIESSAIKLDKKNRAIYYSNASRAKNKLTTMHVDFAKQLAAVNSVRYIVYHDAYQHFAQSYGLQKPIAIALSDARAPGARKLRAIREKAKQTKCVFSELLHDDIIVDTVTAGLPVNRAILDPMGSTLPIGPTHYPQLMKALVNNFVACLT